MDTITTPALLGPPGDRGAVLDDAHVGDIHGALGTIRRDDTVRSRSLTRRAKTLLAITGPGLIVMVGDNDAGAFGTYTQAGQNYGTHLLWTLILLAPVLYIAQEMVLRLGAVTGVGHARLIVERFGRFWGAFSVIDLFVLNALTLVTEFIGISLACTYLGLPKLPTVITAGLVIVIAACTGSFRRFERICLALVAASLLLIPIYVLAHPTAAAMAHGFTDPAFPAGSNTSTVMLLVIGIVGTTVAPWQLFFQQSYVIDKRITPRYINYERVDLVIGIVLVLVGAGAMFGFSAAAFAGHPGFGQFTDAAGVAQGLARWVSPAAAVMFAIALIDASIIGACAVGLSTSYAISDVLGFNHSLHRPVTSARWFYASYAALMALAAALVLTPGVPLGLLTEGVQVLAGVLLPSAVVFLVLLCNDKAVLGPWVNTTKTNIVAGIIVWVLVLLSVILTTSVLYPSVSNTTIRAVLAGGSATGALAGFFLLVRYHRYRNAALSDRMLSVPKGGHPSFPDWERQRAARAAWRMPAIDQLARPPLSTQRKLGLMVLRGYLVLAVILVIIKLVLMSLS